jgi:phage N-6-adenine-methyltransferase
MQPVQGLLTSTYDDWCTPQALFDLCDAQYHFDLDAAADAENTKCKKFFDFKTNSLAQEWFGRVWLNPPYGRDIGKWLQKARHELEAGHCEVVVFLLFVRSDCKWFHDYVWDELNAKPRPGVSLQFLRGRVKFTRNGEAKKCGSFWPSMLVEMRKASAQVNDGPLFQTVGRGEGE